MCMTTSDGLSCLCGSLLILLALLPSFDGEEMLQFCSRTCPGACYRMSWELHLHLRAFCYRVLTTDYPSQQQPSTEPESCCSKWQDGLASSLQLPGGSHAFHDTFQLICHLRSQAGPRPEFCTVLYFHLAILGFSRNVIPLHSTAGTATDQTIFFLFSLSLNQQQHRGHKTLFQLKYNFK